MYGNKALFAAAAVTVLFGFNSEAVAKQTRAQLVAMANSACEAALMSGDLAALEKVRKEYKSIATACSARASTAAAPASRTGSSEGGARSERSFVEAVFGGFGGGAAVNSGSGSGVTEVADNSNGGQASEGSTGGPSDGGTGTGTGGGTESGPDGGGNAGSGNRGNGGGNGGGNGTANEGNAAKSDNAPSDGNRGVGGGNGGGNGVASEGQADKSEANDNGNNKNAGGNGKGPQKD